MIIKKIEINNFRGIEHYVFFPNKINCFFGKNGAGKSSILDAIRFCLIGNTKNNQYDRIRNGAKEASVNIQFYDGINNIEITRTQKKRGVECRINDEITTTEKLNCLLSNNGIHTKTFLALSSTDYFSTLSEKDLNEFLFQVLPLNLTMDLFFQKVGDTNPKKNQYLKGILDSCLVGSDIITFDVLESARKIVYNDRKNQNKKIKDFKTTLDIIQTELQNIPQNLPSEEEIQQQVQFLYQQKAYLQARKKQESEKESMKQQLQNDIAQIASFQNEKKLLEENIRKIDHETDSFHPEEKDQWMAQRQKIETNIRESLSVISRYKGYIEMSKEMLQKLNQPVCPLHPQIVCHTDKSFAYNDIQKKINNYTTVIRKGELHINHQKQEIAKIDEQIAIWERKKFYIDKKNNYLHSLENINKTLCKFQKMQESLNHCLSEYQEIPNEERNPLTEEQLSKKETNLGELLIIHKNLKKQQDIYAELKIQEQRLAIIEWALGILDAKKGIRMNILESVLIPLENLCNQKNKKFALHFHVDNGITISIDMGEKKNIPFRQCSTGEKILVSYALMSIVLQVNNTSQVIIDNLDQLDADAFKMFLDLIEKESKIENIFIAAVNHPDLTQQLPSAIIL